ncbi:MAG: hypothetical protein ACM3UU_08280 [Ignavibacteriales bacterium]
MEKIPSQYNGLVLLHAHLQRLYVYYKGKEMLLGQSTEEPLDLIKTNFEFIRKLEKSFNLKEGLSKNEIFETIDIVSNIKKLVQEYVDTALSKHDINTSAVLAASTLNADDFLIKGLVEWGSLFDPVAEDRYLQKVIYYQDLARYALHLETKLIRGTSLDEEELKFINTWHNKLIEVVNNIPSDLELIKNQLTSE